MASISFLDLSIVCSGCRIRADQSQETLERMSRQP